MRRRRVLRTLPVAAAAIAGCTSGPRKDGAKWGPPETEPEPPTADDSTSTPTTTATPAGYGFETSFEYRTDTEDGTFRVTIVVENTVDVERSAVLVVTWEAGDRTETRDRQVTLAPAETTTFELEFPEVGDLSFDWESR